MGLNDENFNLVVVSFYQVNRLGADLTRAAPRKSDWGPITSLVERYLAETFYYWLGEPDPAAWFEKETESKPDSKRLPEIFKPVTHRSFAQYLKVLEQNRDDPEQTDRGRLAAALELPGFKNIVDQYDRMPRIIGRSVEDAALGRQWMLLFLFHMMRLSGLSNIHERTLSEINRALTWLIENEAVREVQALMEKTFSILQVGFEKFPQTALNSILKMGEAVYRTDESDLVEAFLTAVIRLGFQTPDIHGVGHDWQIKANIAHVQNIRTWLGLIEQKPRWSKKLISALIVHLAVGGVFLKDTDLFPRDITGLLQSDIKPVYNLIKQLCRLFPAYFNEIGAEGQLREVSTRLDEISRRRDPLIHYLRKQSHVESSPQTVVLMEAIFEFWRTRDKAPLERLAPPDIYHRISSSGAHLDWMHRMIDYLVGSGHLKRTRDLLGFSSRELEKALGPLRLEVPENEWKRLDAARELYQGLYAKYHTEVRDLNRYVSQLSGDELPEPDRLKKTLSVPGTGPKLAGLIEYLEILKDLILSSEKFEIYEDIYHKRHIAVDIPSMYGSYREARFDALGLTLRLENLVNILFQELIDSIDLILITRTTLVDIKDCLELFNRALRVDGINSRELERQIQLLAQALKIRGFSYTQFHDIFKGFGDVIKNIVHDHFNNIHHQQLVDILKAMSPERLLPKYLPPNGSADQTTLIHRSTEIFLRDQLASSLGLQQLDAFMTRILSIIFQQEHELSQENLRILLNYDPDKAVAPITDVNPEIADIIHLGAKGYNLVRITGLGLPVPPGFIITTEVFRCRDMIDNFAPAREHFRSILSRQVRRLEQLTGLSFGDPARPLLLSVRSGSSISQPGMMSTFLNVGLNQSVVEGLSGGNGKRTWFAWDCYRRFLQSIGMNFQLERDRFDALMNEYKTRLGLQYKRDFTGDQMREVALAYRSFIESHGIGIEDDPFQQLIQAVGGVFDSWNAPKARTYRRIMGISNDWGTAVTVQGMVFGNLSQNAGSGVIFTHNPRYFGDKMTLWGDFTLGNQGEDVVSGLVETMPVSRRQAEIENRGRDAVLETAFPAIYNQLRSYAKSLIYDHGYGPQELEFTFEGPEKINLYFLQTRDLVLRETPEIKGYDYSQVPAELYLGHGIGVSGGGLAGRIVFDLDDIRYWRGRENNTPLILVRGDTVPDDIVEIDETDGLLTARGGSTSHAAIVAHRLSKTCIVGCAGLICNENEKTCCLGSGTLKSGDWISMDGHEGLVYKGRVGKEIQVKDRRRV